MKLFGYWTLLIALVISVVAAYYSIIGLTAIFAAAIIPIIIMGSALEVAKVTTAVWLHRYWHVAPFLMKTYLTTATVVLMFITSMGIFGFLSKAHIEQTSAANESVAQLERIGVEIARNEGIIARAEERITKAESSTGERNEEIQEQIDKEQQRIDTAYDRIQPAIDEQQAIIDGERKLTEDRVSVYTESIEALDRELARLNDLVAEYRLQLKNTSVASVEEQVKPYLDQIAQLDADIARLDSQAADYEARIAELTPDYSAVDTLKAQIAAIEENIVVTTNKLQSRERDKIREGQATIGVTDDGLFGGNTRRALATWVEAQQARIADLQSQETNLRTQAQNVISSERDRLTGLVKDLRGSQTQAVQERKQGLLNTIDTIRNNAAGDLKTTQDEIQAKIDAVLNTDIPDNRAERKTAQDEITKLRNSTSDKTVAARAEIARLRDNVNQQIVQSNTLIAQLRDSLTVGKDETVDSIIDEQQEKIKQANNTIDTLTEEKYSLEAETRKLEAEVGPVKYIAELVYGETADKSTLEEAVRWVIILLVAVFDPLAIVLVLAGVMTINRFGRSESPPKKLEPEVEPELEEQQETLNKEQQDDKINETIDTNAHESDGDLEPENNDANLEPVDQNETQSNSAREPDPEKIRKPAESDAGDTPKRVKKDHPDNSWLSS